MQTCKLTGKIVDLQGRGVKSARIKVTPAFFPQVLETNNVAIVATSIISFTDDNGDVSLELPQGAFFILDIPSVGIVKKIRVPFTSTGKLFLL